MPPLLTPGLIRWDDCRQPEAPKKSRDATFRELRLQARFDGKYHIRHLGHYIDRFDLGGYHHDDGVAGTVVHSQLLISQQLADRIRVGATVPPHRSLHVLMMHHLDVFVNMDHAFDRINVLLVADTDELGWEQSSDKSANIPSNNHVAPVTSDKIFPAH